MTITTARQPLVCTAGTIRRPLMLKLKLAPIAMAAMLLSAECRADWKFTPRMDLRETYSDNVNNQPDTSARSSWVSEAAPGFALTENSSRLKQGQLPLEIVSRGRFEKSEPTIYHGQDLDVPTYIRRGVVLN